MKECNKCDTAPQSLFPSAFSCAAASVTTALRKRHMLHFHSLPLHSVTLRVTLSEPRDPFQTLVSRRNVTLSREKNRYPRSNRSSALNTARRLSDSLPPRCPTGCSLGCVPGLRAFEPRFAALAGKRRFPRRHWADTRGAGGTGFLSLERASIAFVCTSAPGRRTDKCLRGPCPHPLWGAAPNPAAAEKQNEMEDTP